MRFALGISLFLVVHPAAIAQCQYEWIQDPPAQELRGQTVYDLDTWDPDGEGPLPEVLVATGRFDFEAPTPPDAGIAIWDGHSWSALDVGANESVVRVESYKDDLYLDGLFDFGNGPVFGIAKWNGSGVDLVGGTQDIDGRVYALFEFGEDLIVGGRFTELGGVPALGLAAWNGSSWRSLGHPSDLVLSVAEWQGKLVVATGDILRQWDGQQWTDLVTVPGGIRQLFVNQDQLYVGGPLMHRWDSSTLAPLGKGLVDGSIDVIGAFQGEIVIGGYVNFGAYVSAAARLVGDVWEPLPNMNGGSSSVWGFEVFDGKLVVGGEFPSGFGSLPRIAIAWIGIQWAGIGGGGFDGIVTAFAKHQGDVYAGGSFISRDSMALPGIARRNGDHWEPLGSSITANDYLGCCPIVRAIVSHNGELIIGGDFEGHGVARWDNLAWQPLGSGLASVEQLAVLNGDLIGNAHFESNSSVSVGRWTGTSWEPWIETDGFTSFTAFQVVDSQLHAARGSLVMRRDDPYWTFLGTFHGAVIDITKFDGRLIVGGHFTGEGETPLNNVAAWNGTTWESVGEGVNHDVFSLTSFNGDLFAGGTLVSKWDGSDWTIISGEGVDVRTMSGVGRSLLMGGMFPAPNSSPSFFAEWRAVAALGDFDGNQNLDLVDYSNIPSCVSGPRTPDAVAGSSAQCMCIFNSDADGDVDLGDFAVFQRTFMDAR